MHLKNLHTRIRLGLALCLTFGFNLMFALTANAAVPSIAPNTNFPGSAKVTKAVAAVEGGVLLFLVGVFIWGLAQLVTRLGSDKAGGLAGPAAKMGGAVIALGIIGTSFLSNAVSFFS